MAENERDAGERGAVKRVLGKQQEPEKARLNSSEKRHGLTWTEFHAYKDKMVFPNLPTMMSRDELPKDICLCDTQFRGLDRCIEKGIMNEDGANPYARMQICKPHWIRFIKCVKRRDELVMRSVKKWEREYYTSLDEPSQKEYIEDIDTKMRYFMYAASHTLDLMKKQRLEVNAQHCAVRQSSLLNPKQPEEPGVDV
mmetsp:Transcript_1568/g.3110  ORF Transcript_1568/g.3110 Transcript_1568/m.3110 type:complete len:197 (-) Transcript_1568:112-702(-)|eukprot:CAMPEP_0197641796 /NCGR_PEP_ID=MMETSP1338-20131121/15644_1 /TAXON_ID=43686 ORGANISM="Pelagodinium beii, Strain RCC1491" /NCGR_SAMPLE_ID=MMETSP1338 /ASSEMBLY_ACC=CAM_ASM_000754 /LENGTH=196 /DNA_ID=CAMNT_0043214829 /DNA_START=33 /DNA_END=623 /DNA_ORIENTATION=-